jgi:hypothetical protein
MQKIIQAQIPACLGACSSAQVGGTHDVSISQLRDRNDDCSGYDDFRGAGGKASCQVTSVLRGQAKLIAHGDQEMPMWDRVFWKMSQGHEDQV